MIKRLIAQFNIIGKAAIGSMAPALTRLLLVLVGLVIGLLWAYQGDPVKFRDAEPVHLAGGYKDQWIKMTAVEYAVTQDRAEAARKLVEGGVTSVMIQDLMAANQNSAPELVAQLQGLLALADENRDSAADQAKKVETGFLNGVLSPLACFLGTGLIGFVLALFFTFYWAVPVGRWARSGSRARVADRSSGALSSGTGAMHAAQIEARRQAVEQQTDYAAIGEAAPVSRHVSTYILGDDLYDDSFSIETETGEFLGECGSGISETIGVGDPKKVTATEVWLFDKNDIRTVTKVLMSEHAYNDQSLRAKLALKGEAVLVGPNSTVQLDTQTLRVKVTVKDLQYGVGALPANSYFERLTVEIAAWPKEGAVSGGSQSPDPASAFGDTAELLNY